jgi:hypothetical protein
MSDQPGLETASAQLEDVVGEDVASRDGRETLVRDIHGLNDALEILRF